MNKTGGKYFMVVILAIAVAVTLIGYVKADAQSEAEWQKVLEAGKKEGKVAVYASLVSPAIRKLAPLFKEKFGIEVEVTAGRGSDISRKLRTEKTAGVHLADVIISGGNTMFAVKQLGVLTPLDSQLILPEVTNTKLWYTMTSLPWLDDEHTLIHFYAYPNRDISINYDIVKEGEITSWQDLLKPQYKGKIVWSDPSVPGSGFNGVATNMMHNVTSEAYYRKLVATQEVTLSRNLRQMGEWLAREKYPIAISVEGRPIAEMLNAGAHLAYVTVKEGTYLSYDAGNLGIAAKAPHPNAAKVFTNWFLGKEGQVIAQQATKYMSSRNDIPVDDVNVKNRRVPGEKYFVGANSMEKWLAEEQAKSLALAKEIFGPLIGR
ncbi:MAG: extracellular solute-binding protein [Desulfobacterales bacterium]|nr:extracellular solute-binding protein [Desulfobacterales bacterium]